MGHKISGVSSLGEVLRIVNVGEREREQVSNTWIIIRYFIFKYKRGWREGRGTRSFRASKKIKIKKQ